MFHRRRLALLLPAFRNLALAAIVPVAAALLWPSVPSGVADSASSRALPERHPLRWGYHYGVDDEALASLRANVGRLDVVAPHWLTVDEDGVVSAAERPEATAVLRASNAVLLPSVALTSREAGRRILGDEALAARAIESLVAAAASWDGLALDFEGLDPDDRDALTGFIHRLGAALRAEGKHYAIALPAKTSDDGTAWSRAFDYGAIASAADLNLVMAYGFTTSGSAKPGSTAPLDWVDRSMAYATSRIAPERLVLGVAFYGYDWNLDQGPPARALRHSEVRALIEQVGATPGLDRGAASATFRYTAAGETHEVWFEDAASVAAKLRLVAKYGLRGAGAWRLGQEDPAVWGLWDILLAPISRATPSRN
jgi:spore germination protein YaaH